jgi:hypothetical protein
MRLFRSPMAINLNNPLFELINRSSTFHPIAVSTTWNTVVWNISKIIVYSVYSIIYIFSIATIWMIYLIRTCSTIVAGLFGNPLKKIQVQIPHNVSVLGIAFHISIQSPFCPLSLWKTSPASTTYSSSRLQGTCQSSNRISTITLTKKSSCISFKIWNSFYGYKVSKSLSGNINKCRHNISLKGDSLQLAMLLFRQHLLKSLGVMNKKFAYRFSCLNTWIISQCA